MTLDEWVTEQVNLSGCSKTKILEGLADDIKAAAKTSKGKLDTVSFVTLQNVAHGATLRLYKKAEAIEAATEGRVTVKEICSR